MENLQLCSGIWCSKVPPTGHVCLGVQGSMIKLGSYHPFSHFPRPGKAL